MRLFQIFFTNFLTASGYVLSIFTVNVSKNARVSAYHFWIWDITIDEV